MLTKIDHTLQAVIVLLTRFMMIVAGLALVLMMVQVNADVIGKFLFNRPVPITLEMVSNYYMVAVVFLPFAAVEMANGNISVELVYSHLSKLTQRLLDVVAYSLGVFLFWLFTTSTWNVAVKKFNVGEFIMGSYSVSIWQSRFLVPLGCGLVFFLLVLKLIRTIVRLVAPEIELTDDETTLGDHDPVSGTTL